MHRLLLLFAVRLNAAAVSPESLRLRQQLHFERVGADHYRAQSPGFSLDLSPKANRISTSDNSVAIRFIGATGPTRIEAEEPLPGVVNHLIGSDPAQWRTAIATFGRVRLFGVYQGIDVIFYGNGLELEYDIVVAPGVSADQVTVEFPGADSVSLGAGGELLLQLGSTTLPQRAPFVYQDQGGRRVPIESGYELDAAKRLRFKLGAFDSNLPLVIDPVVEWSTYFGGTSEYEVINDVAVDADGNIYVTGHTLMTGTGDLPLKNPIQDQDDPIYRDGAGKLIISQNAFVSCFNSSGQLQFSTYLGGHRDDGGTSIAVGRGNGAGVYVTGWTASVTGGQFIPTTFPLTPGAYLTNKTEVDQDAIFLTKLTTSGQMVYSTLLFERMAVGTSYEIKVDGDGRAYVGGYVESGLFPGKGPNGETLMRSGAFVFAFNPNGSGLIYGKHLGFEGRTLAIAMEPGGVAHVGGFLSGPAGFQSTPNAFDADPPITGFGFYQKLGTNGSVLYSTRLKSLVEDAALAADGNVLLAGGQAMLTKLDPAKPGQQALVSTSDFGGSGVDVIKSIDVDSLGNIFVAGHTDSVDLPTLGATQTNLAGGNDVFVAQLNPAATGIAFLTYLGGSKNEPADGQGHGLLYRISLGVAADPMGEFFVVAGGTDSPDFPMVAPLQGTIKGTTSGFITRFGAARPRDAFVVNSSNDVDDGSCDGTHCSLREAIKAANEKEGVQTIEFNIPGQDVPVISPLTRLPPIIQPVIIDGTTQPGAGLIELEGSRITAPGVGGLQLLGDASTVRGLVINRFGGNGITIEGGNRNTITECRIGVDPSGFTARPNGLAGVLLQDASENSIGRANSLPNIISGNHGDGIRIRGSSSHKNRVFGNFIGTIPSSAATTLGNGGHGVMILGGKGNRIGSELSGANTIGNNASNGVTIATVDASETIVARNYIGVRKGGALIGNLQHGVEIRDSSRNVIGGSTESAFNFISGNALNGILVDGNDSINNRIQGNIVGLSDTEVTAAPNQDGIVVKAGSETLIGGPVTRPGSAPGNVISGNLTNGVRISLQADSISVQGNVIGTDRANGEASFLGNRIGVRNESVGTLIGGPQAAHRNVISGNRLAGVFLGASATVQGNYIGLNLAGDKGNLNGGLETNYPNLWIGSNVVSALIGGELPPGASPGQPPGNVMGGIIVVEGVSTRALGNVVGSDRNGRLRIGLGYVAVSGEKNVIGSPHGANLLSGGVTISNSGNVVQGNIVGVGLNGITFNNEQALILIERSGFGNLIGGRRLGEGNKLVGGSEAIKQTLPSLPIPSHNVFFGNEIRDFTDKGIVNEEHFTAPPRILFAGPFSGNNSGAVALISTHPIPKGAVAELEVFSSPRLGAAGKAEAHQLLERVLLPQIDGATNVFINIPSFQPGQFLTATLTFQGLSTFELAEPVAFTPGVDSDQDGVPDVLESTVDGNRDTVPDRQQARVVTVPVGLGRETMTVVLPGEFALAESGTTNLIPVIPGGPQEIEEAGNTIKFKIVEESPQDGNRKRVTAAGAPRLSLTIFTSDGFRPNAWLMYGRTIENRDPHWHVFHYDGTSGAEILPDRIILHIVDGGWEDERGFVDGIYEFTGTLARLGEAPLRIEQFSPLSGGDFLLRWSGQLGIRLEESGNLRDWNSLLQTNVVGANPAIIFPTKESDPLRFFRLRGLD